MVESSCRHCVAGLEGFLSDMSCGDDLEDELEPELVKPVANPGTTIGTTIFRIAQK